MWKKVFVISIAATLLVAGCSSEPPIVEVPKEEITAPIVNELTLNEIKIKETKGYEAKVLEFDLGAKEYIAASGKTMPYNLRGIMAVPQKEGAFPLVLLIHGSHDNLNDKRRFDIGFTYLAQYLAGNGYLAVSIDASQAYQWKYGDSDDKEKVMHIADQHIENLINANGGGNKGYPTDLTGKIDVANIAIIGHSRGGEAIFDIAAAQEDKGVPIKSLLAIAPTNSLESEDFQRTECKTSIIVPEYDGDVVSLDGFGINDILDKRMGKSHSLTYLFRANHNNFNTEIKSNDAVLNRTEEEIADQLSQEQQRDFLKHYALDFINFSLLGEIEGTMYDLSKAQPDKMYGLDVLTRVQDETSKYIVDSSNSDQFKEQGAELSEVKDSWFYKDDEVTLDTLTFGNGDQKIKPLLNIRWKSKEDKVSIAPSIKDFSNYKALTWNLLTDSSDPIYGTGNGRGFTVELRDSAGKRAQVVIPDSSNSIKVSKGEIRTTDIEELIYKYWFPITPIGNTRIPLTLFESIDLMNVEEVSICFDKWDTGSVYLESLLLQ